MLRPELDERLLALADADDAAADAGGREEFVLTRTMGRHGARVLHPHLDRNYRIPMPDLEEMRDEGVISLRMLDKAQGKVRVTAEGHQQAKAIRARAAPAGAPSEGGILDWQDEMLPVLQAVYRAHSAAPQAMGVRQGAINAQLEREPADERTARVLAELAANGFLAATQSAWQAVGPVMCKLTEKGLQQVAGWPSGPGDALASSLMEALEQGVEDAKEPGDRNKLERLRDAATAVGVNTLSTVLGRWAAGGM